MSVWTKQWFNREICVENKYFMKDSFTDKTSNICIWLTNDKDVKYGRFFKSQTDASLLYRAPDILNEKGLWLKLLSSFKVYSRVEWSFVFNMKCTIHTGSLYFLSRVVSSHDVSYPDRSYPIKPTGAWSYFFVLIVVSLCPNEVRKNEISQVGEVDRCYQSDRLQIHTLGVFRPVYVSRFGKNKLKINYMNWRQILTANVHS